MNRKGGSLDMDKQFQRIDAIVGDNAERDFAEALSMFYTHLRQHLVLPCEVTGTEDFRWEERYVLGPGDPKEYARLKKSQPSYRDHYELLKIEQDVVSEWMLFAGDDIAAQRAPAPERRHRRLGTTAPDPRAHARDARGARAPGRARTPHPRARIRQPAGSP